MIESIIGSLNEEVSSGLMNKFNLNSQEIDKTLDVAQNTLTEVVSKESSSGLEGMLNLFSGEKNTGMADGILAGLSASLTTNLIEKLGFDSTKAEGITKFIVPVITKLLSSKISGKKENLLSMFEGNGNSALSDLAGGFVKNKMKDLF